MKHCYQFISFRFILFTVALLFLATPVMSAICSHEHVHSEHHSTEQHGGHHSSSSHSNAVDDCCSKYSKFDEYCELLASLQTVNLVKPSSFDSKSFQFSVITADFEIFTIPLHRSSPSAGHSFIPNHSPLFLQKTALLI